MNESHDKLIHTPVMLEEVLKYLSPNSGEIFIDGTCGFAGHSKKILERLGNKGLLIGFDQDEDSLKSAYQILDKTQLPFKLIHDNFSNIDKCLHEIGINQVDGALLDIGISSFQLDDSDRGFSLREDGPLDMRMDISSGKTAEDLINNLSEDEIDSIIYKYGEEKFHKRIARNIVESRQKSAIKSTEQLKNIVLRSYPNKRSREKIHPATRTFQAFRIAVNNELQVLEDAIAKILVLLKPGGRFGVISFHSLEDRIVKTMFKGAIEKGTFELAFKKPLIPSETEIKENSRSRSAKFRVIKRV